MAIDWGTQVIHSCWPQRLENKKPIGKWKEKELGYFNPGIMSLLHRLNNDWNIEIFYQEYSDGDCWCPGAICVIGNLLTHSINHLDFKSTIIIWK